MAKFTRLLAIFFLVNCLRSAASQDHKFEISEAKGYSTAIAINPNGKNILYMACNEIIPQNKTSSEIKEADKEMYDQIVCDFMLETLSFNSATHRSSNCHDVQILPRKTELKYTPVQLQSLQFINDTEVAIEYSLLDKDGYNMNQTIFKIFDLSSCTTTSDIYFANKTEADKIFYYSLIPHNNYLEFLAVDNELCRGKRACSVNYSFNGETLGQPKQFPHEFCWINIYYLDETAPQKGYYLIGIKDTNNCELITELKGMYVYASYIDSFGKENELMKQDTASGFPRITTVKLSTSHELIGGCWVPFTPASIVYENRIVQCVKFSTAGMKLNVTFKIEVPSFIIATHVLANQEIILATADLEDNRYNSIVRVVSFHIYKIGLNSTISKPLLINVTDDAKFILNSKSLCSQAMAIIENLNNELCLRVAFVSPNANDEEARFKIEDSKYIEKCVSKELVNNL